MMRAFETVFPQVGISSNEERRWRIPRTDPQWLQAQGTRDNESTALEMAMKRADRAGVPKEAHSFALRAGPLLVADVRRLAV